MPTLDLDHDDAVRIVNHFFRTFDRPHAVRGTIEFESYVVDGLRVVSMNDYQEKIYRLNIMFGGRRIVILETVRTPPMRPWYTLRGTDEALVEARLRGLI